MVSVPAQGEIWRFEPEDDKSRPVLIVSRSGIISSMRRVVVVPVTRTMRQLRTEIPLGPEEGLPVECVASFDNIRTVKRSLLTTRVGYLDLAAPKICAALAALADC